jgi:hypothetical protein
MDDLQEWIKRHKPVLSTILAQARTVDPKVNDSYYRSLMQLLVSKNLYAVAAWTLPSGAQENNVLVFPVGVAGLVGAFFPLTGIPDLPKSTNPPQVPAQLLAQLPPQFRNLQPHIIAQLQSMPTQQRNQYLHQILASRHQQLQQQRAQHQQQQFQQHQAQDSTSAGPNAFNFNAPPQGIFPNNVNNAFALMGGNQPPGGMNLNLNMPQGAAANNFQRSISGMQAPGAMGFVSTEMLESFMHRTAEGNGGG